VQEEIMKRHEEIQKLAYEMFEKGGSVHGRNLEHWLEAERIVKARQIQMHVADVEAAASKKPAVQRSDVRRHEPKRKGRTKGAR
jgi:hypothetical protein